MDINLQKLMEVMQNNLLSTHDFTPSTAKAQRRPIIAFDSEDNGKGEVSIVDFYDGATHTTFAMERGDTLKDVVSHIYDIKGEVLLFAHNLEYDMTNIQRWCNWCYVDEMVYAGRLITASFKELKHKFYDSFNLCPTSLKGMAKVIGMEKGDYEEARASLDENIKYCRSDTEILWRFLDQFQAMAVEKLDCSIKPTIGSLSMECFRKNYVEEPIAACSQPEILKAFYGGRVELFYRGEIEGDIEVDDVNSMYPSQMLKDYPDTDFIEKSRLATHQYGVGWFRINVPPMNIPPLPYRRNGRLWFPTGKLEGWWTYEEVRYAVSLGCEVLAERTGYGTHEGKPFFREYIERFYALRLEAKNAGDEFGIRFYKLLMNSLFGKFCQHSERITMTTTPADERGRKAAGEEFVRMLGPFYIFREKRSEPLPTTNYLWGVYITSYARIHLHRILKGLDDAGHQPLYCDTDSAFFLRGDAPIPHLMSKELGDMSCDGRFVKADFVNPKGYILEGADGKRKIASKGVPSDLGASFLTSGEAFVQRPTKMREALASQQGLMANYWREVHKVQKTIYIKRKAVSRTGGKTRPLSVTEIPWAELQLETHREKIDEKNAKKVANQKKSV